MLDGWGIMTTREKTRLASKMLSGWKNIATYLGVGVRTVQRYEQEHGLPVRRPAGRRRGGVMATTFELDAWVAASPMQECFHLNKALLDSQERDMSAFKRRLDEMRTLRDQMVELRSELRSSMESLRHSIENLRGDIRVRRWEIPALSVLEDNPETRRLRAWLFTGTKEKKAS